MNRSPLKFFLLVFALSIPFWLIQPRDWPIAASVLVPLIAVNLPGFFGGSVNGLRSVVVGRAHCSR